ncbi:hypothetical protein B9Z55_005583 [Caenorhabditis nigoni]|uniref:Uncharacterized protein n=1 Tax=Caenorhabditis nigoni TaxID=1611254 RepID=A0A2G5V1U0_9PELO|nr:hypothetical protein B9Z55_005583 [Caenorhabditis nigoni]
MVLTENILNRSRAGIRDNTLKYSKDVLKNPNDEALGKKENEKDEVLITQNRMRNPSAGGSNGFFFVSQFDGISPSSKMDIHTRRRRVLCPCVSFFASSPLHRLPDPVGFLHSNLIHSHCNPLSPHPQYFQRETVDLE